MIHNLKIKKMYANAICTGAKTFEVRREDDKHFEKGDIIIFNVTDWDEYYKHGFWEASHEIERRAYFVTYVLRHEDFPEGVPEGYCILAISRLSDDLERYFTREAKK